MFLGRWVGSSLFRNNPDDDQQRRSMRDTFWCDATRWRGISCFVLVTYTIFLELLPKHQIVRKGICFISWSEFLFWLHFTPISWSSFIIKMFMFYVINGHTVTMLWAFFQNKIFTRTDCRPTKLPRQASPSAKLGTSSLLHGRHALNLFVKSIYEYSIGHCHKIMYDNVSESNGSQVVDAFLRLGFIKATKVIAIPF